MKGKERGLKSYTIYFTFEGRMDSIELDGYSIYDALEKFNLDYKKHSYARVNAIIENEVLI